MVGAVN